MSSLLTSVTHGLSSGIAEVQALGADPVNKARRNTAQRAVLSRQSTQALERAEEAEKDRQIPSNKQYKPILRRERNRMNTNDGDGMSDWRRQDVLPSSSVCFLLGDEGVYR